MSLTCSAIYSACVFVRLLMVLFVSGNVSPEPDVVVYFPIPNRGVVEYHPQHPSQTKVYFGQLRERGTQPSHFGGRIATKLIPPRSPNVTHAPPLKTRNRLNVNHTYTILSATSQELECFEKHQVRVDGKCYKLATEGPCNTTEWLVLDKKLLARSQIVPVCAQKPCKSGYYLWHPTNTCYLTTDAVKYHLCPKGNELGVNVFGEAVCTCQAFPPHISMWKGKATPNNTPEICYPVHHKGPCTFPDVLTPNGCERNPCIEDGYGFHKNDSECYELGQPGPCSGSLIFEVDPESLVPACISPLPNRHLVNMPPNCRTDPNGVCRKEFVVKAKYKETEYTLDSFMDL